MVEESKMILTLLGIPYIQAPSEGEAAAAQLTQSNIAFACASQDYDSLLFGAKRLIRNLAISGKRKVPNRNVYVDIEPEVIEQQQLLNETDLNLEQLVDIGILIGTDFNPGGIPGIGPKTALKLVREHNKLEKIEKVEASLANIPYKEIREVFLKQEAPKINGIEFNEINYDALVNFLCTEKNFSVARVNTSLDKVKKSITNRNQSLEKWFK